MELLQSRTVVAQVKYCRVRAFQLSAIPSACAEQLLSALEGRLLWIIFLDRKCGFWKPSCLPGRSLCCGAVVLRLEHEHFF